MSERDYTNDPEDDPNYYDPYGPPPERTPQEIADEMRRNMPPNLRNDQEAPRGRVVPPTATGPQPGDRRDSPDGPNYFEEWNGTRWVRYDTPGTGTWQNGPDRGPTTTGGGGDTGGLGGVFANVGQAPMLAYPDYESAGNFVAPARTPLKAFTPRNATFDLEPLSIDPYTASSWTDAENEPGYAASRQKLKKQVEQSAANRGMARSGMQIGDLYSNLDALSQQNFGQFDDRRFRNYRSNAETKTDVWSRNQGQRLDKFREEFGIDQSIYDRYAADVESGNAYGYKAASDTYQARATDVDRKNNYRFNVADASFKDALSRWTTMVGSLTTMARPVE